MGKQSLRAPRTPVVPFEFIIVSFSIYPTLLLVPDVVSDIQCSRSHNIFVTPFFRSWILSLYI